MSAAPETTTIAPPTDAPATATIPNEATTTAIPETSETAPLVPAKDDEVPVAAMPENHLAGEEKNVEHAAVPVSDGYLTYKPAGLMNAFKSTTKKFFFFGTESPIEASKLSSYLKSEKADLAHHNAAWASHTAKGLLLFSNRAEDKATPEGIINLSEATEVAKDELNNFVLKVSGKKIVLGAESMPERDAWFEAVQSAVASAKAEKENVTKSSEYTNAKSSFAKTGGIGAAAAGTAVVAEHEHDKKEKEKEKVGSSSRAKSTDKGRSQSRKRLSIFGKTFGKSDDATPAEDGAAQATASRVVDAPIAEDEPAHTAAEPATTHSAVEPAVVAASAGTAAAVAEHEHKEHEAAPAPTSTEPAAETPAESAAVVDAPSPSTSPDPSKLKSKRGSVFGSLFKRDAKKDEPKEAKLGAEPIAPATATATEHVAPTDPAVAALAHHEPHSNQLLGMETTPEVLAANQQKPGGDLIDVIKHKKAEHDAHKAEKTEKEAATSPDTRRRSSFFGTLGKNKKEKAVETEPVSAEPPKLTTEVPTDEHATATPVDDKEKEGHKAGFLSAGLAEKIEDASHSHNHSHAQKDKTAKKSGFGSLFRRKSPKPAEREAEKAEESPAAGAAETNGTAAATAAAADKPEDVADIADDAKIAPLSEEGVAPTIPETEVKA